MRASRIIYFFLFNLSLASYLTAAEAASCEANFHTSSAPNVLMFSTWRESQTLNARDAIVQFHQIAEKEGFVIGEKRNEKGKVKLDFFQKATNKCRGFQLLATADENLNTLTVIAALPPGMEAKPEDMRNAMCGMLAKVRLDEVGARNDVAAEPTASTSSKLNVLQPKSIFDLGAAQAALELGTSTIKGTACVVHRVENGEALTWRATNLCRSFRPHLTSTKQFSFHQSSRRGATLLKCPLSLCRFVLMA
ncbi:hypothetical protein [Pseudomonas sp. S35]|uniref:hypothetical protein n=1 Tax=Pseudomonas sp. S35 TaxID=1573719 RepID=UPI00135B9597|nr:hypothetical protein [Pseudomonas sp. S35]